MKITAVIPSYNNADFIADAINSILRQTQPVDEIIVIDDGSTDNTEQIVQALSADIIYFKQENRGPSAARNQGIKLAKGDWIAFLDADDQWVQNKIETQLGNLERYPELRLLTADMTEIDKHGQVLTKSALAKHNLFDGFQRLNGGPIPNALTALLEKNFIPPSTVLVFREILFETGLFNENIRFGEDLELWAKIAAKYPINCLPESLALRRLHGNNATQNILRMLEDLVKVLRSLKSNVRNELASQGCNIDMLIANSLTNLGYWYFSQARYKEARTAFLSSLNERITTRAILYLFSSCLPHTFILGIKAVKQLISKSTAK